MTVTESIIQRLLPERVALVDKDFLAYELRLTPADQLEAALAAASAGLVFKSNPYNSVVLYTLGVVEEFDFIQGRSAMQGGSPPDIDMDFESLKRHELFTWAEETWGEDRVAHIITHGSMKPKSLTRRYFKLSEGDTKTMAEVLGKIPKAQFGKEATLKEVLNGNEEKGYLPHPELASTPAYKGWYDFASKMEGLVTTFGIHAAGIVISDKPLHRDIPTWKNKKANRITQFDMKEVEKLGYIKFDFLAINNIDVVKEACRLIKERHDITIDPDKIQDRDPKAYALLASGLLSGIFQMETSGSAKDLILKIKPTCIDELSDISALNRPGPLENGFHIQYMENKNNGYAPAGMHPLVADVCKNSWWTIVYQETVMEICSRCAGFTLKEADDIRRAMGFDL